MSLFVVDPQKCTRCDLCILECPMRMIIERNGAEAVPTPTARADELCLHCGHCVAVCPHDALALRDMPPEQCPPLNKELMVAPEKLEHLMRARRSVRNFRNKTLAREQISRLIDIARYAPTGSNMQTSEWTVICGPDKVQEVSRLTIDWMRHFLVEQPHRAEELGMQVTIECWEAGEDVICWQAPYVIVAHAPRNLGTAPVDATIALTYLELAAFSQGLGACWAGYLDFAINAWRPLREALSIPEEHDSLGAIMIGHPKFGYHRLPLRNEARVAWIE